MHSLSAHLMLLFSAVIVVTLALINTYPLLTAQDLMMETKRSDMLRTANLVSSSLSGLQTLGRDRVSAVMTQLDLYGEGRIFVTDTAGEILFDSAAETSLLGRDLLRRELLSALRGQDAFRCVYRDGAFESSAAVPITTRSEIFGAVYFYEYDAEQGALLLSMQRYLRYISLILGALTLLASLAFSTVLRRRVHRLNVAISEVREGHYSHRVPVSGRDEISRIAEEFNALSGRLEQTEELRRQFVSNASHELKTPLASIKLLTDSILQSRNMEMEDVREFLGDVSEEIVRLTRITDRLLNLTRLDVNLHREFIPVSVSYVAERAARMLQPLSEHYQVTITCEAEPDCLVLAEEDGMYQILFNLVENALKYNVPGGSVRVLSYLRDDKVTCIVDDTGIGIPEKDLPQIFDRFYRVDKARSRETGGTGLGLAIVQDTAAQYGGRVWAENRAQGGTRFTVEFPALDITRYEFE
ncbi:MAG: HAMP domain-containing histidine kinase [Ruminococcaceae bacterium]|nr:HAMP domain-containing histidine kinase [Oscillospiraceae bacterium]